MADTQRTRAALLALFADNVTGQISAQDFRDGVVTWMETEFVNPGDFFNEPMAGAITTDKTTRGFHLYSQTMHANHSASFGQPYAYNQVSGNWIPADISRSIANPVRGIAADSYASGATTVKMLVKGIVYDVGRSDLSGFIGKPLFLGSGAVSTSGHVSVTVHTSDSAKGIVGYVMGSLTVTYPSVYKWHFDGTGNWAICGQ